MTSIRIPEGTAPVIIAGVAIFIVLIAINGIAGGIASRKVDAQQHYDKLALALHNEGLLPPLGDDIFVLSLATLAMQPEHISYPEGSLAQGSTVSLGGVLHGNVRGAVVDQLEVNPAEYDVIRPGNLRNALREFSTRHQDNLLPKIQGRTVSLNQSVEFHVCPAGKTYVMMPVFKNNRCVKLLIME